MHLHVLDYALWLTSWCLLIGVSLVMLRRGQNRGFPFFFAYILLQVVSDVVLVGMERLSYTAYFFTYWIATILTIVISFALIHELFKAAFERFSALRDIGKIIFRWAVVVVGLAGAGALLTARHSPLMYRISADIILLDRSVRGMLCGLVILLLSGKRYLGISARGLLFGIALGFAMFTLAKVVLDSLALRQPQFTLELGRINSVVYICACTIWLAYVSLTGRHQVATVGAGQERDSASTAKEGPAGTALDSLNSMVERTLRR